jgi:hypothetical protein
MPTSSTPTLDVTGAIALNAYAFQEVYLSQSGANVSDLTNSPVSVVNCVPNCSSIVYTAAGATFSDTSYPPATSVASGPQPAGFTAPTPPGGTPVSGPCDTAGGITTPGTYSCPAGIYTYGLNLAVSGVTVNLAPGNYLFDGSVSEGSSNDTINFGSGQYTFTAGLFATSSGDKLISNGPVLFYVSGGQVLLTATNNDFSLAPYSSGSDANVLLYSAFPSATLPAVTISASATSPDNFGGVVETPNAGAALSAGTDPLTIDALVAQNLTVSGSGAAVSIGVP